MFCWGLTQRYRVTGKNSETVAHVDMYSVSCKVVTKHVSLGSHSKIQGDR